uniref:IS66 family transposase n=1 Tax=Burkholderia gladioli TaxID=28095 RepID=UPI0016418E0D
SGSGPPVRMFSYSPGRGAQHAQKLYAGVQPGTALMTDGYELYNGIAHDHQLVHLGCWAHVRRGFIKAEESVPKAARSPDLLATRFVALIGKLFAAEARSAKWESERRQRLRARYSARVLTLIERMLVQHLSGVVPSSLLGKALQHMSGQWPKLVRYVGNGNWPISNNLCENAIRPFVVGRKGWLFYDTVAGAQASANLYSLVETCKANGIEPYRYLVWLFTRLPLAATADDYADLMPWRMSAGLNR